MLKGKTALLLGIIVGGALFPNDGASVEEEREYDRVKLGVQGLPASHDKKFIRRREEAKKPGMELQERFGQPKTFDFSKNSISILGQLLLQAHFSSLHESRLVKLGKITLLNVTPKDYAQINGYINDYCHYISELDIPSFLILRNFTRGANKATTTFTFDLRETEVSEIQDFVNRIVQSSKAKSANVIHIRNATQEQADEILNIPNISQLGSVRIQLRPTPSKTGALNTDKENGQARMQEKGPDGMEKEKVAALFWREKFVDVLKEVARRKDLPTKGLKTANDSRIAKILAQLAPIGAPKRQAQPLSAGVGTELRRQGDGKTAKAVEGIMESLAPHLRRQFGFTLGLEEHEGQPEDKQHGITDGIPDSATAEILARLSEIDQGIRALLKQPRMFNLSEDSVNDVVDFLGKAHKYSGDEPVKVTLNVYNATQAHLDEIRSDENASHIGILNVIDLLPDMDDEHEEEETIGEEFWEDLHRQHFHPVLREIAQRKAYPQAVIKREVPLFEDLALDREGEVTLEEEQRMGPDEIPPRKETVEADQEKPISLNWQITPFEKGIDPQAGREINNKAPKGGESTSNMQAYSASQNLVGIYCRPYSVRH